MFEVKVKYEKLDEKGSNKKVTEKYVIDTLSVTDAEAIMYKYLETIGFTEMEIHSVTKCTIHEVIKTVENKEDEEWYKSKVCFYILDDSGREKKMKQMMLVQSLSVEKAIDTINAFLSTSLSDYTIESVSTTTIADFIKE